MGNVPNISYALASEYRNNYKKIIIDSILRNNCTSICDLGGGANPLLDWSIIESNSLNYTIIDISQDELDKAPIGCEKIQADLCDKNFEAILNTKTFDFAFSNQFIEHVPSAQQFFNNLFKLLNKGGKSIHLFPTLYALPFTFNKFIPEKISYALVNYLQNNKRQQGGSLGKFPAYYDWCRGPNNKQIQRFEDIGFNVNKYIGLFGHEGYYEKIPFVKKAHLMLSRALVKYPNQFLTSFSYIELEKPL